MKNEIITDLLTQLHDVDRQLVNLIDRRSELIARIGEVTTDDILAELQDELFEANREIIDLIDKKNAFIERLEVEKKSE